MDQVVFSYDHLNDFIQVIIQSNGISYVIDNYLTLREQYYAMKAA